MLRLVNPRCIFISPLLQGLSFSIARGHDYSNLGQRIQTRADGADRIHPTVRYRPEDGFRIALRRKVHAPTG